MAKRKTVEKQGEDMYGLVVSAYGLAAIVAGLNVLIDNESAHMTTPEREMVEGLIRDIERMFTDA